MMLAVGQRWRYKDHKYDFIIEIKELIKRFDGKYTGSGLIVQSISGSFQIGFSQSINIMELHTSNDVDYSSSNYDSTTGWGWRWSYLQNQDRPTD